MDDQQPAVGNTVVKVESIPPLADLNDPSRGDVNAAQDHFEKLLEAYLKDLLEDLGLKTTLTLEVVWNNVEGDAKSKARAVFVNGQECRTPFVSSLRKTHMRSRTLANWAAERVAQNAELLVQLPVSNILRETLSSQSKTCLPLLQADAFNMLLVALVRRGYSVERVRQVADELDESESYKLADILEKTLHITDRPPIGIHVSHAIEKSVSPEEKASTLKQIQETILYDLGIWIPAVDCHVDTQLKDDDFRIRINDLRRVPLQLFTPTEPDRIDPWEQIREVTVAAAKAHAGDLLTPKRLDKQVDVLRRESPDLVDLTSCYIDRQLQFQVLQDLLDEEITIRDLRRIFESFIVLNGTSKVDQAKYITFAPNTANFVFSDNGKRLEELGISDYSAWIRLSLNRAISNQFVRGASTLYVYLLDAKMEARLRRAQKEPLSSDETKQIHDAIAQEIATAWADLKDVVILTTIEVRRPLSRLIRLEFPHLPVLCYQELSVDLNITPIARLSWSEELDAEGPIAADPPENPAVPVNDWENF